MDREDMRRRVAPARVARLGTTGPHVVPITFALAGDTLYTAVDHKPKRTRDLKRLENIRLDPAVSVLVDHYEDDWHRLWWVRLDGRARVVEGGARLDRAVAALVEKYEQYRDRPPAGPAIVIDVTEWTGWSAGQL